MEGMRLVSERRGKEAQADSASMQLSLRVHKVSSCLPGGFTAKLPGVHALV
jgi:hypothetical protein